MAEKDELWIGVLGPLSGTRNGHPIRMPRGRAAVLLAVLSISVGRPVGISRLAELIWPDKLPERVRPSVQTLVVRIRALMPDAIVTAADGYLLDIDPDHVDLVRFRRLARAANESADLPAVAGLLDQALGLWRGEPLADVQSAALQRYVVPGLVEERLLAMQRRVELDLAQGRPDRIVAELHALTGQYPLRESLWGQLIRALRAAGRPAEAIQQYHRAREVLAGELGVDPSAALQDLYQELLRADPGAAQAETAPIAARPPTAETREGVPRQLPPDTGAFTGRQAELAQLLRLAREADGAAGPGRVVISAIDGMAGIGKTALAVHAAHRLAGRFGDGQLFIDLRGYIQGGRPRTASEALGAFLRALGVPRQQVPDSAEERAALYRERLAGTRTLIVLDNAADESQVRPLLPGGSGCLVLVTSRRKLRSLDDARALALDVLPEPDAIGLLCAAAGPGRVSPDDQAAGEIVGLCGRLPLALRIAGALLRHRPTWGPEYLAGKLNAAQERLDVLIDGDRDLAARFDLSEQGLRGDQQRLYRYLGLIPGPEIDAYAAAALLDADPVAADRLLQELVDHNLLSELSPGRYGMHDLIRTHARALAARGPAGTREAALDRLLGSYQHSSLWADLRQAGHGSEVKASRRQRESGAGDPDPASSASPADTPDRMVKCEESWHVSR